ncbi:zinc finger BED domain-containing protein RICESLEEPER 2 [Tanacetum coccineum]
MERPDGPNGLLVKMAHCKFCTKVYRADSVKNGTKNMNLHYPNCDDNPMNAERLKQKKLNFMKDNNRDGEGCSTGTLQNWKYDEKAIKSSLIELIVLAELPFKFVEHPAFIKYSKNLQPKYNLPSRHTISRDVAKFYLEEKEKLVKFLGNPNHTIHLTTDTWTSTCQKINYMVITAHFIDDDWVMHKRVINFKRINSHRGEDIGRVLLKCINGWGIKNVMTITVDNITSNDRALKYLIEHLPSMYDNGKHFHIRCMAHIINLVVKDGLKVHANEVETIGLAVKYIKSSSQRIEKFKGCIKNTCDSNRFLIAECPTRWNSTYDMLKSAIDLQDAFYNYSMKNASFSRDLNAIPRRTDFDVCQKVCDFLEKFKEKTELVSTQSSPVAHLFYSEILDIDKHLREWEFVPKFDKMVSKMRLKYDKYWGDYKKINHYMYFAVLLDPTMKSEVLGYGFRHLMENGCIPEENEDEVDTPMEFLTDNEKEEKVKELVYEVETKMGVLFALYNEKYGTKLTNNSSDVQKSSSTQSSNTTRRRGNSFLNSFKSQNSIRSSGVEDELKKYLKEPILELDDEEDFDILSWWKLNSPRFPIVSKMAKDILSIQLSTVASESAFSTSGRVLDPYRNALSPQIVEALLCTQSWVRTSQKSIYMDDLEDLLKDEEVIKEMKEALDKLKGANGKGSSNSDIDKIMARMDAMTMKIDAQYKEIQSRAKCNQCGGNHSTTDCNDDDTPMSREEEAKFMQTFRRTCFYNDYRDRDSNRDNWRSSRRNDYNRDYYRPNTDDKYDI